MISIQCHRVGEWWSGKPEFENVSDPAGVYIPFNKVQIYLGLTCFTSQIASFPHLISKYGFRIIFSE